MSASASVRGSSSSLSSSTLKSSSSFRTTLAVSVFRRLLSFDLLRAGDSKPGESLLGSFLRLFFCSSSSFSCFSMAKHHCLVCWVCSPASLLYALSSSLEAFDGSNVPSATASFTIAIDSLDKYIFSMGGPSTAATGACCLTTGCPFGCRVLAPVVLSLVLIPHLPASQPSVLYCLGMLPSWWLGRLGVRSSRRLVRCYLTLVRR